MKKLFLVAMAIIGLAFSTNSANAQSKANEFEVGTNVLNLSIPLVPTSSINLLPVSFSYERSIVDLNGEGLTLGLGLHSSFNGSYSAIDESNAYNARSISKSFSTFLGVKPTLHYTFTKRLDTYLGMIIGGEYLMSSQEVKDTKSETNKFAFGYNFVVGTRYYFSEHWAANLEMAYNTNYINLGVIYRF